MLQYGILKIYDSHNPLVQQGGWMANNKGLIPSKGTISPSSPQHLNYLWSPISLLSSAYWWLFLQKQKEGGA
jgi:hypothetical protein